MTLPLRSDLYVQHGSNRSAAPATAGTPAVILQTLLGGVSLAILFYPHFTVLALLASRRGE